MCNLGNIASPDAFVLYLWGPTGPVMEFDTQGHSKALLHDPLGNVLNTTTEDGRAQKPLFYDGYGLPVWPDEEESRVRRQPFQYKGQFGYYTDVHTGLSYCHNRFYDPRMGRWLSRDPIGLAGGTNVYTYCSGDPVNLVDPDGLDAREWFFSTPFGQLFVGENWRLGTYTGGSAVLHEVSFGAYTNKTAEGMPGYGVSRGLAQGGLTVLTTVIPAVKVVQGARVVVASNRLRVLSARRLRPHAIGSAGENSVRAVHNIGDKIRLPIGGGRYVVPDGLTATTLSEVKNVASLSYTRQDAST